MPETSPAPARPHRAPDITVDVPLASRVIAAQFREPAGLPVVQIGAGMADVTAESLAALGRPADEAPAAGSSPVVAGR